GKAFDHWSPCRCLTHSIRSDRIHYSDLPRNITPRLALGSGQLKGLRHAAEQGPRARNIFPGMRNGALVALLCVAGCRARPQETTVLQSDSVDLAQLVPRDSTDGTLLIPRVVTEPCGASRTPLTSFSPAAMCGCTTASGAWSGRTLPCAREGFRRSGGRTDGRTERPRACRYATAAAV